MYRAGCSPGAPGLCFWLLLWNRPLPPIHKPHKRPATSSCVSMSSPGYARSTDERLGIHPMHFLEGPPTVQRLPTCVQNVAVPPPFYLRRGYYDRQSWSRDNKRLAMHVFSKGIFGFAGNPRGFPGYWGGRAPTLMSPGAHSFHGQKTYGAPKRRSSRRRNRAFFIIHIARIPPGW